MKYLLLSVILLCCVSVTSADGPADNNAETVRPIPPVGTELSKEQSQQLTTRCKAIRTAWTQLLAHAETDVQTAKKWEKARLQQTAQSLNNLSAEILVFPRAIELALEFQQFYKPQDFQNALTLLDEAMRRVEVARQSPNWSRIVGIDNGTDQQLIVGGYQSKIDKSYQPYALVVPSGYTLGDARPRRLDIWFHGRGETLSEASFLAKGSNSAGQYTPADTFVLHPYGRYSNAFKFAGEVDVLEALGHVRSHLPVDDSRVSVRGFSMGGAACWQFATHYADRFFAANPGAGFSETPEFLKSFQSEDLSSTPDYQRTLWQLYDCTYWSRNLVHCPTVAYSGEIDRQKQAADVMERSLAEHGIEMTHIIGPQTAHKIHPDSKIAVEQQMDSLAASVTSRLPTQIDFTTHTLRYNRMHWVHVQGLKQHWKKATIRADLRSNNHRTLIVTHTENVSRLKFQFDAGKWQECFPCRPTVVIDETRIEGPPVRSDRSWSFELVLGDQGWIAAGDQENEPASELRKRPGLQGPIDDAFMDSFLFVLPSGQSSDASFQAWVDAESEHAQLHWRKHFRGDIQSVRDIDLTEQQIASHNLILFGDAESNSAIARIADDLPVQWTDDAIILGTKSFPRDEHAIAMIYPNPINPDRYIVLNSGFTFREYDYLNNARQTPKLPDWAIINIKDGATTRDPGKIETAGFFDEQWKP